MSLLAYIFFIAVAIVAMHLFLLIHANKWVGFGVGTGVMVISLIVSLVVRAVHDRRFPIGLVVLFLFINGAASGIAVSSLYTHLGYAPTVMETAYVGGMSAILFAIYCFLAKIELLWRLPGLWICGFLALLLTGGIIGICLSSKAIFSLALLLLIPMTAFLITTVLATENANHHGVALVFASLAALFVILIVVLVVISEGEGLDILDGFGGGSGGGSGIGSYKRNPYEF